MCILAWHWQPGANTELVLLANRDEAYARPSAALALWEGEGILAGRDLHAGGTWLGVAQGRRFAALTNFRQAQGSDASAPSRGALVHTFLRDDAPASGYLQSLAHHSARYNPFNLLVWDGASLLGLESRQRRIVELQPGAGGVSNADFHTPWPKLVRLQRALRDALAQAADDDDLLALLADATPAAEADLPDTGVGREAERALSSIFIHTPHYGTRVSTVVRLTRHQARLSELSYLHGVAQQRVTRTLDFSSHPP